MPDIVKGLEIRKKILQYSLLLESFTSMFLAMALDMENSQDSKTLGSKGSALSFMNKIDLFLDLGAIDSKDRAKFDRLMSIRNQFMHNMTAASYTLCVAQVEGLEAKLLKDYPSTLHDKEKQLEFAVQELVEEVFKLSVKIYKKAEQRIHERVEGKLSKEMFNAILEFMKKKK